MPRPEGLGQSSGNNLFCLEIPIGQQLTSPKDKNASLIFMRDFCIAVLDVNCSNKTELPATNRSRNGSFEQMRASPEQNQRLRYVVFVKSLELTTVLLAAGLWARGNFGKLYRGL